MTLNYSGMILAAGFGKRMMPLTKDLPKPLISINGTTLLDNAINFLIYKAFQNEEITIYDKGNFFRDIIYVSDVVSGIKIIMEKGKSGNIYWISSATKTWFYEL